MSTAQTRALKIGLAALCLLFLFAQTAFAARRLSITYDEPLYTAAGYADWQTGDVRWHGTIGHPPLPNLWAAWPLLLGKQRPDAATLPGWDAKIDLLGFSRALVIRLGTADYVAFVTRVPVMWLAVLLAAFAYRWAQHSWGGYAGLLAIFLVAFDPNIVAHAQLNTQDLGVTAFGFLASYALVRYLDRPTLMSWTAAGLALGAVLASKTTGVFWVGAFGLIIFLSWLGKRQFELTKLLRWLLIFTGMLGVAFLVFWASYFFEFRPLTEGGIPLPAASYWEGLRYQQVNVTQGQTTFLAGKLIAGGHWGYFPLALLVKTPLPTLLGLLVAIWWSLRYGAGKRWNALSLLVVPSAYLAVALMVGLDIGYRHILPLLPFVFVIVARLAGSEALERFQTSGRRWRFLLVAGLGVWYVGGTLTLYPNYLAYFNELAGGPDNGYHYFADSSIDWGQGFKELQRYLETEKIASEEPVKLAAFSSLDPALYGLEFEPLPPTASDPITLTSRFNPRPGVYAISVVPLQGIWVLDPDTYDWFRHREPTTRVGHVFGIYEVEPPEPAPGWVVQCASPLPVLSAAEINEGFGRDDLRMATFDCEQSWLYPQGASGWTVLPGAQAPDEWESRRLEGAVLSFRQAEFWSHPALRIYQQTENPAAAIAPQRRVYVAPSDWPLAQVLAAGTTSEKPLCTSGPLTFLGYSAPSQTAELELDTYWLVERTVSRPLSIMAHLLDGEGHFLAAGDGLGVPVTSWQPGDIIVQRHQFAFTAVELPEDFWLQTGVYWLDTMERWAIEGDEGILGDRILLANGER